MVAQRLCATLAALSALVSASLLTAKPIDQRTAQEVVNQLKLAPNVEKGFWVQTFEDPVKVGNRSVSTLIYYLLEGRENESKWHRVDATEVWHFYAGAPLVLSTSHDNDEPVSKEVLGPDIFNKQTPHVVIPRGTWQRARSLGSWTLVGTTVSPGFVASGFELAPSGWKPASSAQIAGCASRAKRD